MNRRNEEIDRRERELTLIQTALIDLIDDTIAHRHNWHPQENNPESLKLLVSEIMGITGELKAAQIELAELSWKKNEEY